MSVASEIERIKTNIANAYTAIEEKGVITTNAKNSDNLASTISAIQTGGTGGGSTIEKGLIIKGWDSEGFATEIEVVGMTTLPDNYLRYLSYTTNYGYKAKIKLPQDLTSIGTYNFYYTYVPELEIPDSVTYIGNYAFAYAQKLTELKLPSKLSTIGTNAFYSCNIRVLDFPTGVSYIPVSCAQSCQAEVVIIRGSYTEIANKAFNLATSLKAVIIPNATGAARLQSDSFERSALASGSAYLYVPDNMLETFKSSTNWSSFKNKTKSLNELPDEYKELL
jgi:hypothetical protein